MTLRLVPQVEPLDDGRFRPAVVIHDAWHGESVFYGHTAPTQAAALEAAQRLVAAATVELPVEMEVPAPWK